MGLLFMAARNGAQDEVSRALKSGADANEMGERRSTPLIEAARNGHVEVVRLLLEAHADADLKDDDSESAILKAGANGHANVVEVLFEYASPDDRALALAFLKACGSTQGPEFSSGVTRLQKRAAEMSARTATFSEMKNFNNVLTECRAPTKRKINTS
jgi:ankyrin repeat protein